MKEATFLSGLVKEQGFNVCQRALGGAWHTVGPRRKSRPWLSGSLRGAGDLGFPRRDRAGSPFMGLPGCQAGVMVSLLKHFQKPVGGGFGATGRLNQGRLPMAAHSLGSAILRADLVTQ